MAEVMSTVDRFAHRQHVHLTYRAVCRYSTAAAIDLVSGGIQGSPDTPGPRAVAQRLRGTVDATFKDKFSKGRDDGIAWAKHYATVDDLTRLASEGAAALGPHSPALLDFMSATRGERVTSAEIVVSAYWDGFAAGAVEVWQIVHSLI